MRGSRKWPATAWRRLLEAILPALDALPAEMQWTLGGGTALALRLGHRISYDIDLFFTDARALHLLSPNNNPLVRRVAERWQYPGNYIKLERPEGEIDFIGAVQLTTDPAWTYDFGERTILVDTPAEVLAKKLHYRGSRLAPRDMFDALALLRAEPETFARAVRAAPDGAVRAADRIERIAGRYRGLIAEEVNPTQRGAALLDADPEALVEPLRRLSGRFED